MSDYLFVQSQDPFTEARTLSQYQLAASLAESGSRVRMILIQNGVSPARRGAVCDAFETLVNSQVAVLADEFALLQRGIDTNQLRKRVQVSKLDVVVEAMLGGSKVIWN